SEQNTVYFPYEKASIQGRTLKSASAIVADSQGRRIGLFCINFNVSQIEDSLDILKSLLDIPNKRPAILFQADFRENINLEIRDYLQQRSMALSALKRADRIDLVANLMAKGLF